MSTHSPIERRTLGKTGVSLPIIGFGASPLGGIYGHVREQDGIDAVKHAIQHGINYFDTSPYYGNLKSEILLGKALQGVPRDHLIVSTKVGRYGDDHFDYSAKTVQKSITESLERLGLDYIDLCTCHDIEYSSIDQVVNETIPTLKLLQREGKIRHIGVSAFPLRALRLALEKSNDIEYVMSYARYTLFNTTLEDFWRDVAEKTQIGVINASPLSMGLLSPSGPPDWHPAGKNIKETCSRVAEFCRAKNLDLAKLALQFSSSAPFASCTLVGMLSTDQVQKNLEAISQLSSSAEQLRADLQPILEQFRPIKNQAWASGKPEYNDSTP
ncbi:uncharacterized protein LOC126326080 [Schistocerca gregaria]|uniref:uncharacterized protein LOC126326080 n=1 Tax=Schistocerca gregaria TaxID=7010 RepID=UPI00211E93EC|nr:uncharacterized protein LOC126326080 [Schistocerca gregaria]